MSDEVDNAERDDHKPAAPGSMGIPGWGFAAVLALLLLAQFFIPVKSNVALVDSFGFGAWYGFACCVACVLAARVLGWWLKRPEKYYAKVGIEPPPEVKDAADERNA